MVRDFNKECQNIINQNTNVLYNYEFDNKMKHKILQNLEEYIKENNVNIKNVLEVGCFEGSMTKLLLKYENLDIIEPSIECINNTIETLKKCTNEENYTFINTLLQNYETDKKYDLIIISHTLEHIENQIEALKKARQLLSKKGLLYVIVPNGTSISRQIACKLGVVEYPCCVTESERIHGHYITYDLYTLERHIRSANLNISKKGGIVLKIFGNKQYDKAFEHNIVDDKFIDACYELGKTRPLDCASLYVICSQ